MHPTCTTTFMYDLVQAPVRRTCTALASDADCPRRRTTKRYQRSTTVSLGWPTFEGCTASRRARLVPWLQRSTVQRRAGAVAAGWRVTSCDPNGYTVIDGGVWRTGHGAPQTHTVWQRWASERRRQTALAQRRLELYLPALRQHKARVCRTGASALRPNEGGEIRVQVSWGCCPSQRCARTKVG